MAFGLDMGPDNVVNIKVVGVGGGELISVILGWFLIKALKRTEIFDKEE